MKRYVPYFLLPLLFFAHVCCAQMDITGTWEGVMGKVFFQKNSGQFLQINIEQQGDKICGYTYDSVIARGNDHCKAVFEGRYDKRRDMWVLTGVSFIENSGTHVFMRIKLWNERNEGRNKLSAEVGLKSDPDYADNQQPKTFLDNIFNLFGQADPRQSNSEFIQLKRVSTKVPALPKGFIPCFPNLQRSKDTVATVKPKNDPVVLKPVDQVPEPAKPKDTAVNTMKPVQVPDKPVEVSKTSPAPEAITKVGERRNIVVDHLPITVKHITLNIYDNAVFDHDTVSIFYNNKLLVDRQLLSPKPIVIELDLDEKASKHEIILFAHNLGEIPPNTALVIVYAGDKRYELRAKSNLDENAVLVFDYLGK